MLINKKEIAITARFLLAFQGPDDRSKVRRRMEPFGDTSVCCKLPTYKMHDSVGPGHIVPIRNAFLSQLLTSQQMPIAVL